MTRRRLALVLVVTFTLVSLAAMWSWRSEPISPTGLERIRLGMTQDEVEAAIGLGPVCHYYVFQFVVQELFGGLFKLRIDFHEIGQYALRTQVVGLALFERGEQSLHRFGGIAAMRQHLLQRFLAGL